MTLLRALRVYVLAATVVAVALVGDVIRRLRSVQSDREVLVIGAYGNGNYSDDAIGIAIAESIRRTGRSVRFGGRLPDGERIASATSAPFLLLGQGVTSLGRAWRASRGTSAAILGGGGLLEGKPDSVHVHRLVLEYVGKLLVCRLRGIPVFVHGIGVSHELYSDRLVSAAVLRALRSVDHISVRDRASHDVLSRAGIDATLVRDPALPLLARWAVESQPRDGVVGFVGLDRLRWPTFDSSRCKAETARDAELRTIARAIAEASAGASGIELHPFHSSDVPLMNDLSKSLLSSGSAALRITAYPKLAAEDAFVSLLGCDKVVTMRFHPALAALVAGRDVTIVGGLQKLVELRETTDVQGADVYPSDFHDPELVISGWLSRGRPVA